MRYREVGLLAEGGMAVVAQALADDGSSVVVKRVRPPFCFDASFLRLFEDEGAVHAALVHENIVKLLDRGEDEAGPFLVFEHIDGADLARILDHAQGTPLELECVLAIFVPLMRALQCAHEAKDADGRLLHLVHRDVSPGNVLLGVDGSVKLADFGVASSTLKSEATVAGEMKGKFAYMAPEQTRGDKVTSQADLFSAGIVLWECLSGKRLFDGPTDADVVHAVRAQPAPPLDDARLPPELIALTARLLDKDPAQRPASAAAVAKQLEDIALSRGLDEGLGRHAARLARQTPKADVKAREMLETRRRTQRVLGQDAGAEVVTRRGRRWPAIAASLGLAGLLVTAIASARTPDPPPKPVEVVTPLPDPPKPVPVVLPPMPPPEVPKPVLKAPKLPIAPGIAKPKPREGFGLLSLQSEPWASVTVDGVLVKKETPLRAFRLPAGDHVVVLENAFAGLKKTLHVVVEPDQDLRKFVDLNAP